MASAATPNLLLFGDNDCGQLGLEDEEEDMVLHPRPLAAPAGTKKILGIAFGLSHSLWCTEGGAVYSVGANDTGQCGMSAPDLLRTPKRLEALETQGSVGYVAAGGSVSAAVTVDGHAFLFGANDYGQCGQPVAEGVSLRKPRLIKGVRDIASVALGGEHTLLLDRYAAVHACGSNTHGTLGLGDTSSRDAPALVAALVGAPIKQVSAGERHSAALSFSGQVMTWGARRGGALGLPPLATGGVGAVTLPRSVPGVRAVVQIVCGGAHTLARTEAGEVLAWGLGSSGQLGTGRVVEESHSALRVPLDAPAACISAGATHSLALLMDGRRVVAFGSARCGQVGLGGTVDALEPTVVATDKMAGSAQVRGVVAGGLSSALLLDDASLLTVPQPQTLTEALVDSLVHAADYGQLAEVAAATFGSPALVVASFQRADGDLDYAAVEVVNKRLLQTFDAAPAVVAAVKHALLTLLQAIENLMASQLSAQQATDTSPTGANAASLSPAPLRRTASMQARNGGGSFLTTPLLVLLQSPLIYHPSEGAHLERLARIFDAAPLEVRTAATKQLAAYPNDIFGGRIVKPLGEAIDRLLQASTGSGGVTDGLAALIRLQGLACEANDASAVLDTSAFYQQWLSDHLDLSRDYVVWAQHGPAERGVSVRTQPWSFCTEPWLLTPTAKAQLIKVEASLRMSQSIQASRAIAMGRARPLQGPIELPQKRPVSGRVRPRDLLRGGAAGSGASACNALRTTGSVGGAPSAAEAPPPVVDARSEAASPYFVMRVRRSHLVEDALEAIARQSIENLLKPLRVIFLGEPAIDEGGVRKEFFQLLIHELFDSQYALWTWNAESRTFWFASGGFGAPAEYFLIGLILSLAIHNSLILDLHFPPLLYRMLLGQRSASLTDLREVQPDLHRGLAGLLAYDGDDVEDVFLATFAVESANVVGERVQHELIPGGDEVAVTNVNREEYVRRYVDWLLLGSMREEFDAFQKGFLLLSDGPALSFLAPPELEVLATGTPALDFAALEQTTRYDGFQPDDKTIRHFWEVAHSFSLDDKRALLLFATGCDRAPVGGLGNLQFVIQRAGDDSMNLPTSHTCFNMLCLPAYQSRGKLRDRLEIAIRNSQGFGLQ